MTDVFISYSRGDKERVRVLAEELERSGLRVWWDSHLTTGHAYRQEITEKLDEAGLVIVVWSRLSAASRFVCDEADEGAQRGNLFPALIELVDIPLGFRQIQTADLTHWRGGRNDAALKSFIGAIHEAAGGSSRRRASAPVENVPAASPEQPRQAMQRTKAMKRREPKMQQPKKRKQKHTVTGKGIRTKLIFNALLLAALVAGGFGAIAYTSDFVFPEWRPVLVAIIFALTFLARFASFGADKATGAASMRLMSGSFITLFGLAAISIAPLVMEGRLYAGALKDVQIAGIEGADINGVTVGPRGERLVTVSDDGEARVWDARSGVGLGTFSGHSNWVWSADFSPDGSEVATASRDVSIRVWDASTRKERLVLEGHRSSVYDAKYSPDGAMIASGSSDKTVRLWSVEDGSSLAAMTRHTDDVRSVAFSPDGTWIASAGADGKVFLWNVGRRAFQRTIGSGNAQWNEVAFSQDGQRIGAVSDSGAVRVWDLRGNSVMRASVPGKAFGIAFAGERVAVGSIDGVLRIFDIASGATLLESSGHGDAIRDVDADAEGTFFVSGSRDNTARVWEASTGVERQVVGHISSALELPFALDLPPVAVASRAPHSVAFLDDKERTAMLLGKGLAAGFGLLLIGLVLKTILALTPLKDAARLVTPALFAAGVGYYALLMLSALPAEAAMLWGTLAFVPATVLGLIRWMGAATLMKAR
ncbi:TIR domain-containing protein [Parvularcula sp. ZS-1/3]|uniref:TIR domain-containing protein n=1 Tax=Parvularcula mediterranea TaxID=2732508 RepID=A0A7Y3RNE3_9PROT|nr:TIR domain-containing protein [Parvularcula mediterranea]